MIYDVFERLLSDNSRLAKEAVLKSEVENNLLKRVLYLALDPYVRFHVHKLPKTHNPIVPNLELNTVLDELTKLSNREITGNAAVEFLANLYNSLSESDAKVLKKIIDKDLKCGVSISTVNKIWPGLISEFNVQLASPYDPKKLPSNFAIEPKIDGMRVVVINENGDFSFMTRGGRELETLDHLIPELNDLMNGTINYVLDTEVQSGGSLESTVSSVKREGKAKGTPKLAIFDALTLEEFRTEKCDRGFSERRSRLEAIFKNSDAKNLILNPISYWDGIIDEDSDEIASKLNFINKFFNDIRASGGEGAMVKDLNGLYEFDRTTAWMKVKPFEHQDVTITGYYPGRKGTKNEHRLGGFTFEMDGVESRVGGGFSDEQRDEFWKIRDEMVGTIIEIEFMELTAKGAGRHTNFIMRRDFKGEKA